MNKKKVISIILGTIIIALAIIMPFHLKHICYEHSIHPEWSFGAWNAVFVCSMQYGVSICILTVALLLLNKPKKAK